MYWIYIQRFKYKCAIIVSFIIESKNQNKTVKWIMIDYTVRFYIVINNKCSYKWKESEYFVKRGKCYRIVPIQIPYKIHIYIYGKICIVYQYGNIYWKIYLLI